MLIIPAILTYLNPFEESLINMNSMAFCLFATVLFTSLAASAAPFQALATPTQMARIPAGKFHIGCGSECPMNDAKPVHLIEISEFLMDVTPVTNKAFSEFIESTKYVTTAERIPKATDYPDVPREKLKAGSAIFTPVDVSLFNPYAWWRFVAGASWRYPDGPTKPDAMRIKPDHPVVHVTYEDASTYCKWAGKDLPTEAQYEYAARGGLDRKKYAWGDELKPHGKWAANIWQGPFPKDDKGEDGYSGTSPVTAYPKNNYGLQDIAGNVWQWCKDWYRADTYEQRIKTVGAIRDPQGPTSGENSSDTKTQERVQRGGSFLCSDQYCIRYLVGSRGKGVPDSSSSNLGFRCVQNGK